LATTLNYIWPLLGVLVGIYYVLLSEKRKLNKGEIILGGGGYWIWS
jgi:hypothetical protein